MTKLEFDKYVESFNKQPGEFTKEEVIEIGKLHRTLEKADKNWNELAKKVGYSSGDALRCLVKAKLAREGLLENNNLVSKVEQAIVEGNEVDKEELSSEIDRKMAVLFKETTKYNDARNAYKRILRDEARIEVIIDAIKESQKSLEELPKIICDFREYDGNTEAVLLLSDLHLGCQCNNFYNQYDTKIAGERLALLIENVVKYCKRNNVKRLNVLNLGDLIHGDIHVSSRVEQEYDVITQVQNASEYLAQTLNYLQEAAPQVIYRSVVDNHSRVVADYAQHIEKENFSRLIDWYIQLRLKDTNIIFANDNVDEGIGKFDLLNGKKLVFAHGHQDNINTVAQGYNGAFKEFIDYICVGHYHQSKMKSFQDARVFVNGSIVGTEQYALSKRLFSTPCQKLILFEDNCINDIDILLG